MDGVLLRDSWGPAAAMAWPGADWLGAHTLATLYECNECFLDLLQAQAARSAGLFGADVSALLGGLDATGRARAARCAVLLADPGFGDAGRWRRALEGVAAPPEYGAPCAFAPEGAVAALRVILTCAGHLVHSDAAAARLLLGMTPACVEAFSACTVTRVAGLAATHWRWLRPRWHGRLGYWRDLLRAAQDGTATAQAQMRVRGLLLLAGEARYLGGP